ncbi:inducible metalloproteinase inhibitor protein [Bicyclus anynana]|uniref:Inducible metalloproteinase inhibitor protein n=1 Tax=Bicyclus anynana TaxID=110368 RepID=A0A6J1MX13_BICAN|nr:inducible metalloproteinase inhibitor protein [Bicyclus anynana]
MVKHCINMFAKVVLLGVLAFLASVAYALPPPVDEEKPFDCPENEKYYKCSPQVCWKTCDHLVNPPPCPQLAANCYQPDCECIDNYLRDGEGKCIPEYDCPKQPFIPL